MAEAYLTINHETGLSLKLPTLIGKGIFQKFKDETEKPFGEMEIMTIQKAAEKVLEYLDYEGNLRVFRINGHKIPAHIVYELIQFGKK